MANLESITPVFPVHDLDRAIRHYSALGFAVERFDGGEEYAYARWGRVHIHLWEVAGALEVDPAQNFSSAFVYVDDADALAAQWQKVSASADYACPTTDPVNTDYGVREGAHIDADGNLLRFGHRLPAGAE